jgi:hypothetical protein
VLSRVIRRPFPQTTESIASRLVGPGGKPSEKCVVPAVDTRRYGGPYRSYCYHANGYDL